MHKVFLRCAFFLLPLAAAAWAGCSDRTGGDTPAEKDGAAPETAPPHPDVYVPPVDAAPDAARDCSADKNADGLYKHLDCTGLYASFATKTVAADNKAYTPGVQFWSDGAEKSRFLYLPPGAKIDITSFDEWIFPVGTKIWKEFKLDGKRIETRLFVKAADTWRHTDYRWNDAETDAVRKDNGEKIPIAGKAPYEVPNTAQCDYCHAGRKEPILGIEAVSLGLVTAQGVTLATLKADGRFNVAPPVTTFTLPDDGTGKSAAALGWMHANCGHCHNSNPMAAAAFTNLRTLLRPSQLLPEAGVATVQDLDTWKTAVNMPSTVANTDAGAPYMFIAPGSPSTSITSVFSGRRVPIGEEPTSSFQMPPLVTRQVDVSGHALLDAWITAIP